MTRIFEVISALIMGVNSGGLEKDSVGGAISWARQYVHLLTDNTTLILFCIAIPLVGLGIGIIRRLVRVRA